jgi:hypothetical protein
MRAVTLEGSRELTFLDFFRDDVRSAYDCAGVYLWLEPFPEGAKVHYVGRALARGQTVSTRQVAHYVSYIGIGSRLPGWYLGREGDWEFNPSGPNVIGMLGDDDAICEHVRKSLAFARSLRIFASVVDAPDADEVERSLLYQLRPTGTRARGVPDGRLTLRHRNASWWAGRVPSQARSEIETA